MAKITRVFQKIFAGSAAATDGGLSEFGSFAAGSSVFSTDPTVIQSLAAWLSGWNAAIVGQDSPCLEDLNSAFFLAYRQIAYIFQAGVAEWNTSTIYYIGSLVQSAGIVYVSITDDNTSNAITDRTKWRFFGSTIASFSSGGYTASAADQIIIWDGSSGETVTLPSAASMISKVYTIKNFSTTAGTLTVILNGADTIDGGIGFFTGTLAAMESVSLVAVSAGRWAVI